MICTVVKASCLITARFEMVHVASPMVRERTAKYTIYYFKNPANRFYNAIASRLLGKEICGNAIVVGATAADLQTTSKARWSDLASKFDRIELSDKSLALQEAEERERREAWEEYQQRKQRRIADAQTEQIFMRNLPNVTDAESEFDTDTYTE